MEALNWTGDYFVEWIKKIAREDIKAVVPKRSAVEAFVRYGDEIHQTLVWTSGCTYVDSSMNIQVSSTSLTIISLGAGIRKVGWTAESQLCLVGARSSFTA